MKMIRNQLQRRLLEDRLYHRFVAGDIIALQRLHALRRLWRTIDSMKTTKENHHD